MSSYVSEIGVDEIEHFDVNEDYKKSWYQAIKTNPIIGLFVDDQLSVAAIVGAVRNTCNIKCLQIHTVKETNEVAKFAQLVEEHYNVNVRVDVKMRLLYEYCKTLGFVDVAMGYIGKNIGVITTAGTIKPAVDVELFEIFKCWYREGVITYAEWQHICKNIKIDDTIKILECEHGKAAVVYHLKTDTVYIEAMQCTGDRLKLIEIAIGSFDPEKYKAVFINVPADWVEEQKYLLNIKFGIIHNFMNSFFEKGAR